MDLIEDQKTSEFRLQISKWVKKINYFLKIEFPVFI